MHNVLQLKDLTMFNARMMTAINIEPVQDRIEVISDYLIPIINVEPSYLKQMSFQVEIVGDSMDDLIKNKSVFLNAIREAEMLTIDHKIFYRGKFNAKNVHGFHNQKREFIEFEGIVQVLSEERVVEVNDAEITIVNKGELDVPVTIISAGEAEVVGLTEDEGIKFNEKGAIYDDGRIINSTKIEMMQFPRLKVGENAIRVKGDVIIRYRERLR